MERSYSQVGIEFFVPMLRIFRWNARFK